MALTQVDRELIQRCLQRQPAAWQSFVDRFSGLFVHVIRHTAESRSVPVSAADVDDIAAEVFTALVADDFRILRHFRGKSSLATYLTVVTRRIAVHALIERRRKQNVTPLPAAPANTTNGHAGEFEIENRDLIEHLIAQLPTSEARIVRAYHLDGKSYHEISDQFNIPENSIGPVLTRAREQLRKAGTAVSKP